MESVEDDSVDLVIGHDPSRQSVEVLRLEDLEELASNVELRDNESLNALEEGPNLDAEGIHFFDDLPGQQQLSRPAPNDMGESESSSSEETASTATPPPQRPQETAPSNNNSKPTPPSRPQNQTSPAAGTSTGSLSSSSGFVVAVPAGAKSPRGVRIGEEVVNPQARARRMTLAVDLNEYKAQLEQNDLQTKKTQTAFKGIRGLVSKKKKRFIDNKYDLDLAYITDRLIAMGFPSEGREGIIRNPMGKVVEFFEERHANHYKVYNLCSERTYKTVAFRAPVKHFGFDDHNPPTLELLDDICKDVAEWLDFDQRNVAALHCKAGKGRTGTVICAYLADRYRHKGVTAQKALDFFADRRTHNSKGVTIAGQIRWVHYYYEAKMTGLDFTKSAPLMLNQVVIHGGPNLDGRGGVESYFVITSKANGMTFTSKNKLHIGGSKEQFTFDVNSVVDKDVKLQWYRDDPKEKKEKLKRVFHVWFNTHFIKDNRVIFTLKDNEIDGIKKIKSKFSPNFAVEFIFSPAPKQ